MFCVWDFFVSHYHSPIPLSAFFRRHLSQGLKFAIVGGTGSSIDLSTLMFSVEVLGWPKWIAGIPSTLLAVTVVFLLNKYFTFQNRERRYASQILKFAFVYGVAVASNIALYNLFLWLGVHYFLAKVLAIAIGALWNYAMSHGFVFRKSKEAEVTVF